MSNVTREHPCVCVCALMGGALILGLTVCGILIRILV